MDGSQDQAASATLQAGGHTDYDKQFPGQGGRALENNRGPGDSGHLERGEPTYDQ